jgi:hypothetical protein
MPLISTLREKAHIPPSNFLVRVGGIFKNLKDGHQH